MKTSTEIQADLEKINAQIEPLERIRELLKREESDALSREFIAANEITLDRIEMSDGDGKPYFDTVWKFGEWLYRNSQKPWAEWNGLIYATMDLVNGRMPKTNGMVSTLEKP
jgi:hypothetical protein